MKLLFLAPQPFFIERGTPIAVKLALEVLSKRKDLEIDLLTYHEGKDVEIAGVRHTRAGIPKFIKNIGPGLSLKKIFCDIFFLLDIIKLITVKKEKYDLIHSVEESVFMAWLVKKLFGIPYVYDMDSAIVEQSTDKWKFFGFLKVILNKIEGTAIKDSKCVIPVCEALSDLARARGAKQINILRDISFYQQPKSIPEDKNINKEIAAAENDLLIVYVGNLERYQGIDLLMESFSKIQSKHKNSQLVIIGGSPDDVAKYRHLATQLAIGSRTHLLGARPVSDLSIYLSQADILASPRITGTNTPMKIYSYLHSGNVVIATDLPTHTQAMDGKTAQLAKANVSDFGAKLLELLESKEMRERISVAAKDLAEREYSLPAFEKTLNEIYDELDTN